MLQPNQPAPEFSLLDQDGKTQSLAQYLGKYILVYFYPKDDTPGCTKEACAIKESYHLFEKNGIVVFGISADSVESHQKFAQKYSLPFILLSDPKKETIKNYGALGGIFTKRISYLINKEGIVIKAYPKVDPTTHGAQILQDFQELQN